MSKFAHTLQRLPKEELHTLQQELQNGVLQQILDDCLADVPQHVCPGCSTPVTNDAPFVLYFGTTIRQKARFDALDCLQFFLRTMRGEKHKR